MTQFHLPPFANSLRCMAAAVLAVCLSHTLPASAAQDGFEPKLGQAGKDVMWLPTPDALISRLLKMANLEADDTLVDLGSGDGKIVLAAARDFGARARGVEYDPRLVDHATQAAKEQGLSSRASFVQGDIFKVDFSDADVVAMYLLPQLNLKLRPTILAMAPGTRIVTHWFDMGEWQADERTVVENRPGYLWIVPANIAGEWQFNAHAAKHLGIQRMTFTQRFQRVQGTLVMGEITASAVAPRLVGGVLTFEYTDLRGMRRTIQARVDQDRMRLEEVSSNAPGAMRATDGDHAQVMTTAASDALLAVRTAPAGPLAGSEPASEAEMARAAAVLGAD